MSLIKKEVRVCDFCDKELTASFVKVTDVPNEGSSEISIGKLAYTVGESDFCSLNCFFNDIKSVLCKEPHTTNASECCVKRKS